VKEFIDVNGPQKIDLGQKGIYFVRISTENGARTVKMIIK